MHKIGCFSKLVNASIKAIRYYNEINLLKPFFIDPVTRYRYYNDNSICEYYNILELKKLGFSLREIRNYLNNLNDSIMENKKKELLKEVIIIKNRIKRIDYLRARINNGRLTLDRSKESEKQPN